MKDIARDLAVSVVTVSKVVRNHSDIGAETRDRVLKRIKELNYKPNPAARALVTGRTYSIGFIVPDLVHPFFGEVAKGISQVLRTKGYSLLISSSEENPELERKEIEQLLARRVDALLIASTQSTIGTFRQIEERNTPYVLIDRQFYGLSANFVGVDDKAVGDLATEHLIAAGYRRIAHIRGSEVSTALGRLEGYRRALARNNLALPAEYVVAARASDEAGYVSGYQAMLKLVRLDPRPDAVFCYNDSTAMGAMKAIVQAGLRMPDDIAVIGCGNEWYAPALRVPLSSVDQQSVCIGQRAAKVAVSLVGSKGAPVRPKIVLLQPKVIVRESTSRSR
jgi:LacI family transcriptional regulator